MRDLSAPGPRSRAQQPAKLEAYTPIIAARLVTYPELSAVRLCDEVRAAGDPGGITQLRDYLARVRPRLEPEPVVGFETAPGLQARVDFADLKFPWGERHALLVVLGYSLLLWLRFYPRQTMLTAIAGLEAAFTYVGGVPQELLLDQMKPVVRIGTSSSRRLPRRGVRAAGDGAFGRLRAALSSTSASNSWIAGD